MTTATDFRPEDVELLLAGYTDLPRRPPWSWPALSYDERLASLRMCDAWVGSYNAVDALAPEEVVPPCWPLHNALLARIPVWMWLYYEAYVSGKAVPGLAADYQIRMLPAFQSRVDRMLGRNARQCREGKHDPLWRSHVDKVLDNWGDEEIRAEIEAVITEDAVREAVETFSMIDYGVPLVPPKPVAESEFDDHQFGDPE